MSLSRLPVLEIFVHSPERTSNRYCTNIRYIWLLFGFILKHAQLLCKTNEADGCTNEKED